MQLKKNLYNTDKIWFTILIITGMIGKYFKSSNLFQMLVLISAAGMIVITCFVFIYESKKLEVNKIILIYILTLICSMIINLQDVRQYALYIATILAYYMFSKILEDDYIKISTYVFLAANIVNMIFINKSEIYLGYKNILGLILVKHVFLNSNIMEFSTTSILSLYLIFLSFSIESKMKKILIMTLNIILIVYLGKLSVILTGVLSIIITFTIRLLIKFYPKKHLYLFISIAIVMTVAILGFILPEIINGQNLTRLFSGRLELWENFNCYIVKDKLRMLFGYGFVNQFTHIGNFYHPHNQYITVLYTTGVFGYISYISILIYTLYTNIIYSSKLKKYNNLYLLLSILMLQVVDDYFVLTSFPLTICIIIYYFNNSLKLKKLETKVRDI